MDELELRYWEAQRKELAKHTAEIFKAFELEQGYIKYTIAITATGVAGIIKIAVEDNIEGIIWLLLGLFMMISVLIGIGLLVFKVQKLSAISASQFSVDQTLNAYLYKINQFSSSDVSDSIKKHDQLRKKLLSKINFFNGCYVAAITISLIILTIALGQELLI